MKIKFLPTNQVLEGDPNKTLLQICNENKIEIKSICKGVPSCAECRIRLVEGEHNVMPPSKAELSLIGTNYFIDQRRLSCQIRCFGDITVDLSEQISRADTQKKKVRGFRQANHKSGQVETHAKQGTLILEEPAAKDPAHEENNNPPQEGGGGGNRNNRNRNRNNRRR
jgi:ferredoxin